MSKAKRLAVAVTLTLITVVLVGCEINHYVYVIPVDVLWEDDEADC